MVRLSKSDIGDGIREKHLIIRNKLLTLTCELQICTKVVHLVGQGGSE